MGCHHSLGKNQEAAALLEMLHNRVEDVELGDAQGEPLARLHPLFERIHKGMPTRVSTWRCRVLAILSMEAFKVKQDGCETPTAASVSASAQGKKGRARPKLEEFGMGAFPPRYRDI